MTQHISSVAGEVYRAQVYDAAAVGGPLTYLGYVGYEHNGIVASPAVTVNDFAGTMPFSTQSTSTPKRS